MLLVSILGGVAWLVLRPRVAVPSSDFPKAVTRVASAGSWARDEFIGVTVFNAAAGTILGSEPYRLDLGLRNPTSMRTSITRIVVLSRNQDAANLFGLPTPQVFEHQINVPYHLDGGQNATIPLRLNQILPKELTVRVYHTLSGQPSEFVLDLNTVTLPMPAPRRLRFPVAERGYDSMAALRRARAESDSIGSQRQINRPVSGRPQDVHRRRKPPRVHRGRQLGCHLSCARDDEDDGARRIAVIY